MRMLIDTGALLAGMPNHEIAEELLNRLPDAAIKGILYFDADENMMILERGRETPIPFESSPLKPDQLFTYCDHRHIFGARYQTAGKSSGALYFR